MGIKYCIILFVATQHNEKRRVAQFGRALRSGRRGRRFKSCRFDYQKTLDLLKARCFFSTFSQSLNLVLKENLAKINNEDD